MITVVWLRKNILDVSFENVNVDLTKLYCIYRLFLNRRVQLKWDIGESLFNNIPYPKMYCFRVICYKDLTNLMSLSAVNASKCQ